MKRIIKHVLIFVFYAVFAISSCSVRVDQINNLSPTPDKPSLQPTETPTSAPTSSPTLQPTPTPTATNEPISEICSPLQSIKLGDLNKITSQGFTPSAPYKDDGHPAIDLAFYTFKELASMIGHPVQSIFPGTVSLVIEDRYPYGNAIMIETPLELISNEMLAAMTLPTPIPQENLERVRQCESNPLYEDMAPLNWSENDKSMYVIYAHLLEKPKLKTGESVSCGQVVGVVGSTGNSAEEHLHLELRIGPSEAQFGIMSMYFPDATIEERYSYCIWTSSGRFQPINPAMFWVQEP